MKCTYCGQESQSFHENRCPYCKEIVIVPDKISLKFNNNGNGDSSQLIKEDTELPNIVKKDRMDYFLQNAICITFIPIAEDGTKNSPAEERHYKVHVNTKLVITNVFVFMKKLKQSSWQVFQLTDLKGYVISDINNQLRNMLKNLNSDDLILILNSPNAGMVMFNWKIPCDAVFLVDNIETFDNYLFHVLSNLPKVSKHSQLEQKNHDANLAFDNLKKLSDLKNFGVITEQEFVQGKQKLLSLL